MILDILKVMGVPFVFGTVFIPSVQLSLYLGDKIGSGYDYDYNFRKIRSWLALLTYFVTLSWSLIFALLAVYVYVEGVK